MASISAGVRPGGRCEKTTWGQVRASGGESHSKVTAATCSPAPMAKRISVAEGRKLAMRIPVPSLPLGLKSSFLFGPVTAWLKPCPFEGLCKPTHVDDETIAMDGA